jgi:hypothetical protein
MPIKLDVLFKSLERKEVARLLADTKGTFPGVERIVLSENQYEKRIEKLELFLDYHVPTWRSEIERERRGEK